MIRSLAVTAFLIASSVVSTASAQTATLRAGAATSNITPELGSAVIGGFAPFPSTHVHDELHARCLVIDNGKTRVALVVTDLLALSRNLSIEARKRIQEQTGIPPENVLISATHTHSAASALGDRAYTSNQTLNEYQAFVAKRIADGVKRALNLARPAEFAFGTAEAPEHLFNRRWIMKDGTAPLNPFGKVDKVKMNPPAGSPNLVEPAGPTDPTISFVAIREKGGRMISVYSAYSLHYVGGIGDGHISADYYGAYCEALKKLLGADDQSPAFVALMANGTSGDVNNINFKNPRPGKPSYVQMQFVAEDIAAKVKAALSTVKWTDQAELAGLFRELPLAWRTVSPELLKWAVDTDARGKTDPKAKADVVQQSYATRVQRLAKAEGTALAPVQVLKIGDVCIGSSPCETFTETGLAFKKRSAFKKSFMVELAHASLGYLPTPRHFPLGGYETWPGTNYLEPDASEKILDALVEMSKQLP